MLRICTTRTAAFFISGATRHSILSLPVNFSFNILSDERLCLLQDNIRLIRVIIIDEVSMLGKQMYFIDQRPKKGSGEMEEPFGGFGIIFVGNFQTLPPIGDTPIYDEDTSDSYLLYSSIQYVVVLQNGQLKIDDTIKGAFRRILSRCKETETQGGLLQEN